MNRYRATLKGLLAAGLATYALLALDLNAAWVTASLFALAALTSWLAWREWHKPPAAVESGAGKPRSLRTALVVCGSLLAIDALFFGAPALGAYAALALVLWLAPRILLAWRDPVLRRHRGRVALIVLGAILLDCGVYVIYEIVAQRRVTEVAEALVRYKARTGAYPEQLRQLVPDYLPGVPPAKPGFVMLNAIWYHHRPPASTSLMYVSFPPYGRKVFDLETLQWSTLD
jgi:hypothetical protein